MRRRGFRRGRARSAATGRLLERLRDARGLALREVRPLERLEGAPADLELGYGIKDGTTPVALVASCRDGVELAGWARVAVALGTDRQPEEVIVAAPTIGPRTRRALAREAEAGLAARAIALPALAEEGDAPVAEEALYGPADGGWRPASQGLLDRVVRVLEGAAIVTGSGVLRRAEPGQVLYVHGVPVLSVTPEGDGVAVTVSEPEKRHIHVTDGNFPRWGLELHELVVQLAQDPRLLDRPEQRRQRAAERSAATAGVRVAARWLPWGGPGDLIDWVGVDRDGRPTAGFAQPGVGLADVPGLVAGLHLLAEDAATWLPGARGRWRLVVATEQLDGRARALLESLDLDLVTQPLDTAVEEAPEGERRGRRRSRRRRRGRDEAEAVARGELAEPEAEEQREREPRESVVEVERPEPERIAADGGRRGRGRRDGRRRESRAREAETAEAGAEVEAPGGVRAERESEPEAAWTEESEAVAGAEETEPVEGLRAEEPEAEPEVAAWAAEPDAAEADAEPDRGPEVAEADDAPEEPDEAQQDEEQGAPPARRRRSRAAIAVCNAPDSILAALVLARDRRHVPFFWVCGQDELMDFFRGKATDLDENTDLLMVGFTAQPVPGEVIGAAELYCGRIQWFDAHPWPIEDLERLRQAIGPDSAVVPQDASGPLAAVMEVTERRSRFTDKLVDLSARRLGENDMRKWGYRLVGALERMAAATGDHRNLIQPVLAGRPAELPEGGEVYGEEERWLEAHDPTLVHFGEYQMAVLRVPPHLDAGELGRKARMKTGARLSLSGREGEELVMLGSNEEKRHINVMGLVDRLDSEVSWAHAKPGGDRLGRIHVEALSERPERFDAVVEEIVRHKSVLYG